MITLPRTIRVWAYGQPSDLRKGYNGLVGLVDRELAQDPMSGDLFLVVIAGAPAARCSCGWDGPVHLHEAARAWALRRPLVGRREGRAIDG
jgi:IS66 Orf2 like protein